jgi:hypothetical protein
MADEFTFNLKRLLELFQKTWAERGALRVEQAIDDSGHAANWETVLQAAQTRAQELFQPALLDLDNDVPPTLVLETLLDRLEASRK